MAPDDKCGLMKRMGELRELIQDGGDDYVLASNKERNVALVELTQDIKRLKESEGQ